MTRIALSSTVLALAALLASCGTQAHAPTRSAGDLVTFYDDTSTLEQAVVTAGLEGTLDAGEEITLLAPTNAAFEEVAALASDLCGDAYDVDDFLREELLGEVLAYHVADGAFTTDDFAAGPVTMSNGVEVALEDAGLVDTTGRAATLVRADVIVTNGVFHAIDKVLLPADELDCPLDLP
jgi:uncharacterized surface protein with fasciclin (FAS1) repeats